MITADTIRRSLQSIEPREFERTLKAQIFERDPALLKAILAHGGSTENWLGRFAEALDALGDKRRLAALAASLAAQHGRGGIPPRAYTVIGQALMATLAALLGPAFTGDLREVTADCFVRLAEAVLAARYNTMDLVA